MRVGAFDRSMFSTHWKKYGITVVCSAPEFFLATRKLRELKTFEVPESQILAISDVKHHEKNSFFKIFKNDVGPSNSSHKSFLIS